MLYVMGEVRRSCTQKMPVGGAGSYDGSERGESGARVWIGLPAQLQQAPQRTRRMPRQPKA